MYQVETLIDKRVDEKTNRVLYLVKWQNYDIKQSSWETVENLQENCLDAIQQFEKKYGNLPTTQIGKIWIPQHKIQQVQNACKLPSPNTVGSGPAKRIIKKQQKIIRQIPRRQTSNKDNKVTKMENQQPQVVSEQNNQKYQKQGNMNLVNVPKQAPLQNPQQGKSSSIETNNQKRVQNKIQNANDQPKPSSAAKSPAFDWLAKRNFCPIILKQPIEKLQGKIPTQRKRLFDRSMLQQIPVEEGKQRINIIGMRKRDNQFQFYVINGAKKMWMPHKFVSDTHVRQLCRFYERNMILE